MTERKKLEPYIVKPEDADKVEVLPPREEPKREQTAKVFIRPKVPHYDEDGNPVDQVAEGQADHVWMDWEPGGHLSGPEEALEEGDGEKEELPELRGSFLNRMRQLFDKGTVIRFLLAFAGQRIKVPTQEAIWKAYRKQEIIRALKGDDSIVRRDQLTKRYRGKGGEFLTKDFISHLAQEALGKGERKKRKAERKGPRSRAHPKLALQKDYRVK